jgi:hypothetical protein
MDSDQLRSALVQCIPSSYETGVFACDQLNHIRSDQFAFIFNSDTSEKDGTHWLALFKDSDSSIVDFFDSFGKPIQYYANSKFILNFVKNKATSVNRSNLQIQSNWSEDCGQHCLFFLINRVQGSTFQEILLRFSKTNLDKNDEIVKAFYLHNFTKNKPCININQAYHVRQCCVGLWKRKSK